MCPTPPPRGPTISSPALPRAQHSPSTTTKLDHNRQSSQMGNAMRPCPLRHGEMGPMGLWDWRNMSTNPPPCPPCLSRPAHLHLLGIPNRSSSPWLLHVFDGCHFPLHFVFDISRPVVLRSSTVSLLPLPGLATFLAPIDSQISGNLLPTNSQTPRADIRDNHHSDRRDRNRPAHHEPLNAERS